jgi:hypothetical protein
MATPFKITWFFNAQKEGFSESWYITSNSAQAAMNSALGVAPSRAAMIGTNAFIEATRVSDETIIGDSLIDFTPFSPTGAASTLTHDQAAAAILCRVSAQANLYRRQLWLRAIPDVWIQFDVATDQFKIDPTLTGLITLFESRIVLQQFQLRVVDKSFIGAPAFVISDVQASPIAGFTRVSTIGVNYADAVNVRIKKCKFVTPFALNGSWTTFNTGVGFFDVRLPFPVVNPQYLGQGVVRIRSPIYVNVEGIQYERPATRRTGRAFFVPRGRRRVKR